MRASFKSGSNLIRDCIAFALSLVQKNSHHSLDQSDAKLSSHWLLAILFFVLTCHSDYKGCNLRTEVGIE